MERSSKSEGSENFIANVIADLESLAPSTIAPKLAISIKMIEKRLSLASIIIIVSLTTAFAASQSNSPGLLLLKRQPWDSSPSDVLPFLQQRPRSDHSDGYHSYYLDRSGKEVKVTNALITSVVSIPTPDQFPTIRNDSELADLTGKKADLESVAAKCQLAEPFLKSPIAILEAEIKRFGAGDRKVNGVWLCAGEFAKLAADRRLQVEAEVKRLAELRAAEQKRAAEIRAEEARVAEVRRTIQEEQRKVKANAEQKLADAVTTFQQEQGIAASQLNGKGYGLVSGQVFVATKGGENVKLGAVRLQLFTLDSTQKLMFGLRRYSETAIRLLADENDAAKAAYDQAEAGERAAYDAHLKSLDDEAKQVAYDRACEATRAARVRYVGLREKAAFYVSGNFFFSAFEKALTTAETDAEGRFTLQTPKDGKFVIAAQAERYVGAAAERYFWLIPVSLQGEAQLVQNFSNNNLTSAADTNSIIRTSR